MPAEIVAAALLEFAKKRGVNGFAGRVIDFIRVVEKRAKAAERCPANARSNGSSASVASVENGR